MKGGSFIKELNKINLLRTFNFMEKQELNKKIN
jgi:hypothetical protein